MDWTASWIWHPPTPRTDNFYLFARREFTLERVPAAVAVNITASSLYRLFVNGRIVGRGPNPTDPSRYYYDVHDIAPFLRPGKNAIAVIAYSYSDAPQGIIGQNWGRGGLLVQVHADGAKAPLLVSDAGWKVLHAPEWDQAAPINCTLYADYKEYIDTRKEIPGWMEAGFDDRSWSAPLVIGKPPVEPWTRLVEREIPWLGGELRRPVSATWESASVTYAWRDDWEVYHEQRLVQGPSYGEKFTEVKKTHADFSPSILLDFNELVTGYPEIRIAKSAGGVVDVLYGEGLNLVRVDRFVLKGGAQVLQAFNRRTFRYLKLVFPEVPERIEIDSVSVEMNTYPVEHVGAFSCSDDMLTDIWKVGAHTMRLSMLDHFVDCPWRERTTYGGDVYPENRISMYAFGDPRLNRKTLRQMFALQYAEGALPPYGPYRGCHGFYPAWSAHFGLAFIDHWWFTGDRSFLEELWPNFVRLCDWTVEQAEKNSVSLVGSPAKGGDFDTWKTQPQVSFSAWEAFPFQVLMARGADLAKRKGHAAEAGRWAKTADAMAKALRETLIDPVTGLAGPSNRDASHRYGQNDTGYALWSGVPERGLGREAADRLVGAGVAAMDTGFNAFFVIEGMLDYGAETAAVELMRRYWGEMIRRGATTFWEYFSLDWPRHKHFDRGLSACHGWSAGPTYTMPARLLGVRPLEAGFERILVAPILADLDWAAGTVPTPHGVVQVRWQRSHERLRLELTAPRPARVLLPAVDRRTPSILVDGKPVASTREGDRYLIELGAGAHVVEADPRS